MLASILVEKQVSEDDRIFTFQMGNCSHVEHIMSEAAKYLSNKGFENFLWSAKTFTKFLCVALILEETVCNILLITVLLSLMPNWISSFAFEGVTVVVNAFHTESNRRWIKN